MKRDEYGPALGRAPADAASKPPLRSTLDDDDVRRRLALRSDHSAVRVRRADERRELLGLCRHFLAPTLRKGDVVVMDNLPRTKSSASGKRSSEPARRFAICRPTARLQSHRTGVRQIEGSATKSRRANIRALIKAIANASTTSNHKNAQITSQTLDIVTHRENALAHSPLWSGSLDFVIA